MAKTTNEQKQVQKPLIAPQSKPVINEPKKPIISPVKPLKKGQQILND